MAIEKNNQRMISGGGGGDDDGHGGEAGGGVGRLEVGKGGGEAGVRVHRYRSRRMESRWSYHGTLTALRASLLLIGDRQSAIGNDTIVALAVPVCYQSGVSRLCVET